MEIYRDKLIEAKHILEQEGPAKFYDFLEKCGFPYATLANGVAKGDSFAGNAALDFMKATALHEGRPLSEDDVNNIRVLMANGYLNALERKMGDTNILTEEITYREAWDFHSEIFTSYGLSADAWTLNSVFQSLTEAESNDYWEMVLSSAGNPSDEKSLAMITLYKMFIKTDLMDGDVDYESENNARFINWFMRAATPESIAEFSAIFGEKIGNLKTVYYDQFFGDRVISERGNDLYMESQTRMLYDPLVLDLDGDGIETVSSDAGIKFDFDGDGLKTATGWIGSDDGILTIDKNNNGKIDDGAELFGVDYVKADGNKAIDGYDALRDLDSNADGVFNASDDKFNSVKVWRDLNQDGIAQADELRSLQDHGIVSIELSSKPVNIDANGNIISQQGTYYKNTGEKGSVEGSIQDSASINFSENPFHSEFTDKLPLGQEEALLPNISGRGVLRGLQEAATLNQNLITLVGQFNADSSPTTKTQIIGQILSEWAATGVFTDLNQRLLESGAKAAGFNLDPAFIASDYVQKMMILEKFNGSEFIKFEFSQVEPYDTLAVVLGNNRHWITKSNEQNVEIGTGNIVLSPAEKFIIDRMYNALVSDIYSGVSAYGQLKSIIDLVGIDMSTLETGVKYTFDDVVDALKVSFEQDAIGATRDLIDIINIFGAKDHQLISLFAQFTDGFEASDFAALGALPPEFIAGNPLVRTEVLKYNILLPGDRVNITGNNGADFIISNHENNTMSGYAGSDTYIITANSGHDVIHEYTDSTGASENTVVFAGINTTEINEVLKINGDLIIKYQNNSSLTISRFFLDGEGTIGKFVFDDQVLSIADLKQIITIRGTDSNDVVTGFSGAVNKIEALDGDDHISAGNDGSVIHAGAGNDHIAGGNGDDLIFGEAGNDTIAGNLGNDTYVFSRGDGQDVISDYNYDSSTDKIIFKDVLSTEIVSLVKHNQDLIIDYGHGDKLTLLRYFDHEQAFNGGIEFSDGSGWARENILSKVVVLGTDNNDVLVGFNGAPNTILAGAGDDSILGSQDGNTIYGGAGNDSIAGGIGDDLIFGESGNDTINGYTGSDTYVFSRGDGQDTVKDVNDDYVSSDKIIFN
ncbi:MAG: calcium-binding protein, partial [Hafnia sp.]